MMPKKSLAQPKPPSIRPLPPSIVAWGEANLSPDNPYRYMGERVYPAMHTVYSEAFAGLPTQKGFTPVDFVLLISLGGLANLNVDAAVARLTTHPTWKYALRLPLEHPGCDGDALWRFFKRTERMAERYHSPIGCIVEMVRMTFVRYP